jgi:acetolactate synthase-1/2/3 large subunit
VPDHAVIERCRRLLRPGRFAIWIGFGARHASAEVLELAERTSAVVMSSPRAKGVMPESHPLYLGVTGLGGHATVEQYLADAGIERVLVLGSRLGELTSFWSKGLAPSEGFLHVDLDASVFGAAFPHVPTLGVQADVGDFLRALLRDWAPSSAKASIAKVCAPFTENMPRQGALVRYSALLSAIQRRVVEGSNAIVLTEAGNSFMLGSHYLAFDEPGRYRVSTQFGSMGQASAGVLGAAAAHGKAVALVGDGALLMFNELSTAAKYGIAAVWIVLNDARYGMIEDGMLAIGWEPFETDFPRADFVAISQAMGVPAVRVEREVDLDLALLKAVEAKTPYLIDVWIDPSERAPSNRRNVSLVDQGVNTGTAVRNE